jgi:hypothetical protein
MQCTLKKAKKKKSNEWKKEKEESAEGRKWANLVASSGEAPPFSAETKKTPFCMVVFLKIKKKKINVRYLLTKKKKKKKKER